MAKQKNSEIKCSISSIVVFRILWSACNQTLLTDGTVISHSLADWLGNFIRAVHTIGLFSAVVF
jgi:hypothetical protein